MANLFFLPWAIVRDVAGVGIPGAQMFFTVEGGNTKSSVYQDEALTTAHTNPVICDGVGNPPIIYLNPAVSYRVRFYDRDAEAGVDTPIKDFDPYVPGIFADASALEPVADAAADSAAAAAVSAGEAADSATEAAGAIDAATQAQAAVASITAALGPSVLTLTQLVASGMPLNALWFGGGRTEAEINAAIAESKGLRNTGEGYASAGPPVYAPYGDWTLNSPIAWDHPLQFFGDFGSGPSGGGTVFKTASNITALLENPGASGSIIRNLFLKGSYVATESAAHGIHLKDKATIRDVFIEYFAGDGIYADTAADSSNVNDSEIHHPFIRYCRNGIYLAGADANGCSIIHPEAMLNRQYGWFIKDTLGSTVVSGDLSSNGWGGAPTMCIYNSKHYYVLPGQETWCQTNAPSGTTANNTGWGYLSSVAGSYGGGEPAWVSGITNWRAGGAFRIDGGSERCSVFGGYMEPDQPPGQMVNSPTSIIVAAQLSAVSTDGTPYGGQIQGQADGVYMPRGLLVGSLPTGVLTGSPNPRGIVEIGLNSNEHWRVTDSTAAAGWYATFSAGAYITSDGNTGESIMVLSKAAGGFTFGRVGGVTAAAYFPKLVIGTSNNGRIVDMATAAPATGDRAQGEIVWNNAPTLTAPSQWVCTVGHGSSGGTWTANYLNARADPSTGVGYVTGAGGAITQATSKSTAVTLNKVSGQITMHNASLADNTKVSFTLNNSVLAATDTMQVNVGSGAADAAAYTVRAAVTGAGVAKITLKNDGSGGALGEAVVVNFSVLKAVAA